MWGPVEQAREGGDGMSDKALAVIEGEVVDKATGEIAKREDFQGYAGVATFAVTDAQAESLAEQLPDEDHDILPTGEVYVSQVFVRRKLNGVFKPGGWALVPRGPWAQQGKTICREYALVGPGGVFLAEAIGEADYHENNDRMSYASACEAAKSNALTRCCKDLGIASECWDRRFAETFKAKFCVKVWREKAKNRKGGSGEFQWRRKDAPAWYDERGGITSSEHEGVEQPKTRAADQMTASTPAPAGALACTQCGGEAKPQKYPGPGKTHYCTVCAHAFEPGKQA